MIDREKIIKALECCDDSGIGENLRCEDCPYSEGDSCSTVAKLHKDALAALQTWERDKEDFSQIEGNLKSALIYEQQLNKQLMGRLDAAEQIVGRIIKIMVDKIAEGR